jgi:hypothetical protein
MQNRVALLRELLRLPAQPALRMADCAAASRAIGTRNGEHDT